MPKGTFTDKFDFTFPSRAQISYRAGWSGPVKAEVAEAALAAGKFVLDDGPETVEKPRRGRPPNAERLPGNLPAELATPQALTPNLHEAGKSD